VAEAKRAMHDWITGALCMPCNSKAQNSRWLRVGFPISMSMKDSKRLFTYLHRARASLLSALG
jgi:hypothetical protein